MNLKEAISILEQLQVETMRADDHLLFVNKHLLPLLHSLESQQGEDRRLADANSVLLRFLRMSVENEQIKQGEAVLIEGDRRSIYFGPCYVRGGDKIFAFEMSAPQHPESAPSACIGYQESEIGACAVTEDERAATLGIPAELVQCGNENYASAKVEFETQLPSHAQKASSQPPASATQKPPEITRTDTLKLATAKRGEAVALHDGTNMTDDPGKSHAGPAQPSPGPAYDEWMAKQAMYQHASAETKPRYTVRGIGWDWDVEVDGHLPQGPLVIARFYYAEGEQRAREYAEAMNRKAQFADAGVTEDEVEEYLGFVAKTRFESVVAERDQLGKQMSMVREWLAAWEAGLFTADQCWIKLRSKLAE